MAKRHLGDEDAFFLATGVDISDAVFRFQWRDDVFFNMRPDFAFMSLASDCGEQPINAVESEIRDRLLDYYRETEAIKRAVDAHEIEPLKLYPAPWWKEFWTVRGFAMPSDSGAQEKPPHECKPTPQIAPPAERTDALDQLLVHTYLALGETEPKPSTKEVWKALREHDRERIIKEVGPDHLTWHDPDTGAVKTISYRSFQNRLTRTKRSAPKAPTE